MEFKLVFVTKNQNKVSDAKLLLPDFDLLHFDFDIPEIQSLDIKEIAEHKIKFAFEESKKPCFILDTSLSLDCLNGFPGPFVKWYFFTVGAKKTCQMGNFFNQTGCKWTTILCYFDGFTTYFLEETIDGNISSEPIGNNGYDWDVIFIPKGEIRTFAQMTFEEKQKYAVTKKLFDRFTTFLKRRHL